MQMDAREAWDLLDLLALGAAWGESADAFVAYYTELRKGFEERDWALISRMAADYAADPQARMDEALREAAREELGMAGSRAIVRIGEEGLSSGGARALGSGARPVMDAWLRTHTPMRDRVFRTTRETLRRYKAEGFMPPDVNIPVRTVDDRFVPLAPEEARLYRRIETYISRFYDAYREAGGEVRRALGFIMTVYRRRLTSSFRAVELSLQRRRKVLEGGAELGELLDQDDLGAFEGSVAEDEVDVSGVVRGLQEEVAELRSFLAELDKRPPNESKMDYLLNELEEAFAGPHDTVVIFTQYTDTMDYIRDQLVTQYGARVGCYSGRGGELWDRDRSRWAAASKEQVKTLFKEGRDLKILIGTDSMSEGLNLQTCGKLVNYDMPWNFMRVEQRIGRVDRIGGQARVSISNYFYEGTVEEQIYRGIAEDFEWFEDVVGPAQPVLNLIESAIEDVAMQAPSVRRAQELAARVEDIRRQIETARRRPVTLEDMASEERPTDGIQPAIDLVGLERVLTTADATAPSLVAHAEIPGAYLLSVGSFQRVPVTFRRDVLDEHAPTVTLLSYGSGEFAALIDSALGSTPTAGLSEDSRLADFDGIETLADIETLLATP